MINARANILPLRRGLAQLRWNVIRLLLKPIGDDDRLLMTALGKITGQVLSPDDFQWYVDDDVICIEGKGRMIGISTIVAMPGSWRIYVPRRIKLYLGVRAYMRDLQKLASRSAGSVWPAPNARCHVRVTRRTVRVWWAMPWSRKALVRLSAHTSRPSSDSDGREKWAGKYGDESPRRYYGHRLSRCYQFLLSWL